MPIVTAAQVSEQLERWQRGQGSAAELAQWARAMRAQGEPANPAVNAVLARMQVLGRGNVSGVDIQVLREALNSNNASGLLNKHFGAFGKAAPPDNARDPRVRARARYWRFHAKAHRWFHVLAIAVAIVTGGAIAAWMYWRSGIDFDYEDIIVIAIVVGAVTNYLLNALSKAVRLPRCPFCEAKWNMTDDDEARILLTEHRCPKCQVRF
jgi:hypothetical protein